MERRSNVAVKERIIVFLIVRAPVSDLECFKSKLGNGLEKVSALRILASVFIQMVELHQINVFLLMSGPLGEALSEH